MKEVDSTKNAKVYNDELNFFAGFYAKSHGTSNDFNVLTAINLYRIYPNINDLYYDHPELIFEKDKLTYIYKVFDKFSDKQLSDFALKSISEIFKGE